ncbi:flagellar filament capping protein FliD [Clostridium butyricum]|uniref:flagellar filament capping protein FliD n=1 Tax=Clostridium butyricum TaxID=1492 RepID=UPI001CA8FDE1|nr:flagellar filament capping protein FliD [Clostridium butyricum]MBZ0312889.1 flagellar filament capping protein FliD [Clostridium butyricum]
MTNRITGTNSGIDVDAVVKASLTTEQNKIDKAYQQQKVYEYQQEQLRKIVDQCTDFYDKYLDILSSDSLMKSSAYESVSFTGDNNNVTAKGYAGADTGEYKVNVTQLASNATTTFESKNLTGTSKISVNVDGKNSVEMSVITKTDGSVDLSETAKALNEKLSSEGLNITAKYSELSGGIVLQSSSTGSTQKFTYSLDGSTGTATGSDAVFKITKDGSTTPVTKTSSTNTLVVDNIEFTANKVGETTLNGKNDGTELKDTIVNFINDYNKLITTINEKLLETRDKDYMPLTEDQKADMSESEIKKWEEKAQTGLLRNDNDLVRIQSALKESMRTFMSNSGLNLEAIGIKPVDNYGSKNGTFTIDEDKLTKAIENNAEGVKDLFTKSASTNDKGGILTQLQSVLKNETKLSSSALSKRIGFIGTSTENSNTLKTNIIKQKKLMSELQGKYTDKENALYKKYSALETMLEKLNSQSNSLYSMLNIG